MSERRLCREGFVQAINSQDVNAAADWLAALSEFQMDTYGERLVLKTMAERIVVERQIAEDTCEQHELFCCPVCFDLSPLFESGDPADTLDPELVDFDPFATGDES